MVDEADVGPWPSRKAGDDFPAEGLGVCSEGGFPRLSFAVVFVRPGDLVVKTGFRS